MDFINTILEDGVIVYLDSRIYSKDSLFKCLYWYTDKYHTNIELIDDSFYKITVRVSNSVKLSSESLEDLLLKVERDFLDFNLRDIVTKETKNIRDLLTAKAFSHGEYDEEPPGSISDPVGFIPK